MKIMIALAAVSLLSPSAHASSLCAGVGEDWHSVKCESDSPYSGCMERSPESIKSRQDCEDGIAARDAALLTLAARVGAADLAGKTVYGWGLVISTSDATHRFDLLDLLIKTLDKAQSSDCRPGDCPAIMK